MLSFTAGDIQQNGFVCPGFESCASTPVRYVGDWDFVCGAHCCEVFFFFFKITVSL